MISTPHCSVLTVYGTSNANPPAYAVRNEQEFLTPGIFSCNSFSIRICPADKRARRNGVADLKTRPSPYELPSRTWAFCVKRCRKNTGEP